MEQEPPHGTPHSRLHPYRGEEMERLEHLGQPHRRHGFGHDDGRTYLFNSLGFRGPEPDPAASHRVYVFGESHAFGYFVELEQSWPWRFVDLWCDGQGIDRGTVEYLNFADPGASNASIARLVITQCTARRPDLALVHFADVRRSETLLDGRPHRIGPWLLEDESATAAREAPGDLPLTLLELIERGKGYFRHHLGREEHWLTPVPDATCLLAALREILLVQSFCRAAGIRLVATCDRMEDLRALALQDDPILAPLAGALDPASLCDFGIWSMDGEVDEASGHADPARHERFARAMLEFYRRGSHRGHQAPRAEPVPAASAAAPSLASPLAPPAPPDPVRELYRELPFNHFGDAGAAARSLRDNPLPETYPDLHRLLLAGDIRRVIDCGCGTGWLANGLALHYGVEVVGLDFTSRALERAREVAHRLGLGERVTFVEDDLHAAFYEDRFDLLVSLGVLHHTPDPRRAFDHVRTWAPQLYVGLYHQPGRAPFLEHFRRLLAEKGEDASMGELRRFGVGVDDEHLRSWFRDQVMHTRETLHTLREILGWLDDAGLKLVSTSVNRFRPPRRRAALFRAEQKLAARSRRALRRRRFFPGFFTFLARRI